MNFQTLSSDLMAARRAQPLARSQSSLPSTPQNLIDLPQPALTHMILSDTESDTPNQTSFSVATSLIAQHRALATPMKVIGTAALLSAMVLLAACSSSVGDAQAAAGGGMPPAHVNVAEVISRAVTQQREYSGRVEAIDAAQIRPRVSGYIVNVGFKSGALVHKGDVLFVIDPRPYKAELDRAQAAAASSRAKADLAKIELDRSRRLLTDNAIAQRDFDERESTLRQLEAGAQADEAALQSARLNYEWTSVRAPFEGRVGKAEVTAGNLVDGSVVLTSLVSNDPVYVSFNGDESAYLQLGALARSTPSAVALNVALADETGFPHTGHLEFVDNQIDPATGSLRMRAVVDNRDGRLTPGLFAKVQLGTAADGQSASALVAERAIGTDQDRKFVYVLNAEHKAEYRPIQLGIQVGELRVIRGGLKPGDQVIVDGLQQVRPGAPVEPQTVPMDAPAATAAAGAKTTA